jgi:hypothetical protein
MCTERQLDYSLSGVEYSLLLAKLLEVSLLKTSGCPWPMATLKPRCENPGLKVEIPSLENHVLKTIS